MGARLFAGAALATAIAGWAATPASAACYEDVGCTDSDLFSSRQLAQLASCQILWEMRNGIYDENGFCFKTARAIRFFGNEGCLTSNAAELSLNRAERSNVAAITSAERRKGC